MSEGDSAARAHVRIDNLVESTNTELKEIRNEMSEISRSMEKISARLPERPCPELRVLRSEFDNLHVQFSGHTNKHARAEDRWWQVASRVISWAITGAATVVLAGRFMGKF